MPFSIIQRGGEHCVIREGNPKPLGCHATRDEALAQLRAVQANEKSIPVPPSLDVAVNQEMALALVKEFSGVDLLSVTAPPVNGFKAFGENNWIAWYTNNFEDREGEIISLKALQEFTDKANAGEHPMPELWFHHVEGTRHGVAKALFLIDHFAIAFGEFDDPISNKFVSAMKSWYDKQKFITVSHGFEYKEGDKTKDGVYNSIRTHEISSLPAGREANSMTRFMMRGDNEHFSE